jgi:DNA-binding beta-propeller fold protein YncE
VYVTDVNNQRVQILSIFGTYEGEITEADFLPLFSPHGLTTDTDQSVFIVDSNNHRVLKFDASGGHEWSLGGRGGGNGQFQFPKDVCVDGDGFVYVLDTGNHRVQKFQSNGVYEDQWGEMGSGNGEFATPSGIAASPGFIYVADSFNHRIQKFTDDGAFVASWEGHWNPGVPRAIATDAADAVYVVDSGDGKVQKFTSGGTLLSTWGQGDLGDPEGIWVDPGGDLVWVADTYNHRIRIFERQ